MGSIKNKNLKKKKQIQKRKQKRKFIESDDDDRMKILAQLKIKYGNFKKHENETIIANVDTETMKVNNPSSFERQIRRAIDAHLNRLLQPEQPVNLIQSKWLCVFCQNGNCDKHLGELFGPYFASASHFTTPIPDFLIIDLKTNKDFFENKQSIDLWMHGDCALWASELQLIAGRFPFIEQLLSKYWTQTCKVCSKIGASIPVYKQNFTFLHYPCAVKKNYYLNEFMLICKPP